MTTLISPVCINTQQPVLTKDVGSTTLSICAQLKKALVSRKDIVVGRTKLVSPQAWNANEGMDRSEVGIVIDFKVEVN